MVPAVLRPTRTVVTSFTPLRTASSDTFQMEDAYEQGDWVLCLASSSSTVSCSLSGGQVQVYDQQRLHMVTQFDYNKDISPMSSSSAGRSSSMIKDLCYCGPDGNLLVAAGEKGSLVVLDLRQSSKQAVSFQTSYISNTSLETVAVGCNTTVVAVGNSRGKICLFDIRTKKTLATYGNSHTDAVAQVAFSSTSSPALLSGSEDGLACCFDTLQPSEDLALKSVCNVGSPLRRVGFCGDANQAANGVPGSIYCLTGSETVSLWDWGNVCCLQRFGDFQLRDQLTQSMAEGAANFSVEYLIDAKWDSASSSLVLATGNHMGDGATFRLTSQVPDRWQPSRSFLGGHRGVIRAWCPMKAQPSRTLTAGEDARVVEWDETLVGMFQNDETESIDTETLDNSSSSLLGVREASTPPRRDIKRHKLSTSPG